MISYQPSIKTNTVSVCTEDIFYLTVMSDNVKVACNRIAAITAKMIATNDETERRRLHDEKQKLKQTLPVFVFQAIFPHARRKQSDARLNGMFMVDFDDVDHPETVAESWIKDCAEVKPGENKYTRFAVNLGIMLIAITPSYRGLRIVAQADSAIGNLADNQHALAAKLGLKCDESCKDASRVSYAFPMDSILYINNNIFTYENEDYDKKFGDVYRSGNSNPTKKNMYTNSVLNSNDNGTNSNTLERMGSQTCGINSRNDRERSGLSGTEPININTLYKGVPYKDIINEFWAQNGGEPVEGERNAKLLQLCSRLRYICDNNPQKLAQIIPTYGLSPEEVASICNNACSYKMWLRMPQDFKKVLKKLLPNETQEEIAEQQEVELKQINNEEFLQRLDKLKINPFFSAVMSSLPQNVKIGGLLASLPMIYTLASRVRFDHFDGKESRLSGMTFIIGAAASGKSFILELDRKLMEPIRIQDQAGRKAEQEYRESKELNKNKQKQQDRPHPVIRITPIQISNTMLALRMRDAIDSNDPSMHLHVYSCESELATAIRAQKGGSWIEKNDIYCKSFHNEKWGMDYANDNAVNGEIEVNLNLVISGTEDAFDKLIPPSTVLSGLPTRLMYFSMPSAHYQMIAKTRSIRTDKQNELLSRTAFTLNEVHGKINAKPATDAMYNWCKSVAQKAELEQDEELDDLRKRTALIGERAAVAYALTENIGNSNDASTMKISKDAVNFGLFVADYCLVQQYYKFAATMKEQKQKFAFSSAQKRIPMRISTLYNSLPVDFTLDVLQQQGNMTRTAAKTNVCRWRQRGYIKGEQGTYNKIIKKI